MCFLVFFAHFQLVTYYKKEYLKIVHKIFGFYVYNFVDCVQIAKKLFSVLLI
jgi:hypothetical protein